MTPLKNIELHLYAAILNACVYQRQSYSLTFACGFQETVKIQLIQTYSNSQNHVNKNA